MGCFVAVPHVLGLSGELVVVCWATAMAVSRDGLAVKPIACQSCPAVGSHTTWKGSALFRQPALVTSLGQCHTGLSVELGQGSEGPWVSVTCACERASVVSASACAARRSAQRAAVCVW